MIKMPQGRTLAIFELREDDWTETITNHIRFHIWAAVLNKQCPCCKKFNMDVMVRRVNTEYVDDSRNWMFSCSACYKETYDYYADMWSDYYADVM